MSSYDLFRALKDYYGDTQETLDEMKSFCVFIKNFPKLVTSEIENVIEEEALGHKLCSNCFNSMNKRPILNETVEYQGREVNEKMEENYCPECGWSSEG